MNFLLEEIAQDHKLKLSVQFIALYLRKGYKPPFIARVAGTSHQAVYSYIDTHYEELAPLLEDNELVAMKAKGNADKALNKLNNVLEETMNKKDLISLTAVADRMTQIHRLYSDQSTNNVSIKVKDLSYLTAPQLD